LATLENSAPPTSTPVVPAKNAELNRAKIQLAMRRAALKKAQASEASAEQIEALEGAVSEAERQVDAYGAP
jgi:electron transport complex protein RnfB